MLRGFVVLRVIVVTTLLVSALLIQLTFSISLPLNLVYYLAAFAYGVSILSVATLGRIPPAGNASLQLLGDLFLITGLVYLSRGPESSFTFLYLATVTAGAVLLGRQGGLITAGLAAVFYAVLVQLMKTGALRAPAGLDEVEPRVFSDAALVSNVAMNVAAFLATGWLVSVAAEKLHDARDAARRRERDIARLMALHASVLSSMSSGLLTTGDDGLVTFANRAAFDLLGRPRDEVEGRHVGDLGLVDADEWRRISASHAETVRLEGTRPALGAGAYFGITATPLRDEAGRTSGRILIFQNLTDLKRLEGEVRLKEKMAAVGELAAGIAHEIRNPLASISGSVQVLRSTAVPESAERRLMEIVVSESQRLSRIIEDFLKYVKPRERSAEPVDAAGALRDVMSLLHHSDEVRPEHLIVVDVPPEPVVVEADPGQIRQIFWNLARNALAAMPEGGRLTVTARHGEGMWRVAIRDEGRGMTAEERDRLFTPFAHSFPGGTGLGLAIVYRIVEEHRGTIHVETAPMRGTTITISLPEAGRPAVARAAAVAEVA